MADNSAKAVNIAKNLAIAHLVVGFALFCFGISDRITEYTWTGDVYFGIWIGVWLLIRAWWTDINMAYNSAKAVNMAGYLAIAHLVVGFPLFCFGISDGITVYTWTGDVYFGIWISVWMCITGVLGILGTRKDDTKSRNIFARVFMGFSITSALLGGVIIICYSISIASYREFWSSEYDAELAVAAILLILGIVEFFIGILTAICLCAMKPCCNKTPFQQGQILNTASGPLVLTQGSSGTPVAITIQGNSSMFAAQTVTTGAQGNQLQMIMIPVAIAGSYQPQGVQAAPAGVTGYQPLQDDLPPPYEEQPYMTYM